MALNPSPVDPAALAEMERFERTGELLPGAARKLAGAARSHGATSSAPLHVRAEAAAKVVASPLGRSYANPDYTPPAGDANPLRRVLTRYQDMLSGGMTTVETLTRLWSADFVRGPMGPTLGGRGEVRPGGFTDESRITRAVLERLNKRENWTHLKAAPSIPAAEERLSNILYEHFSQELKDPALAARQWAGQFVYKQDHEIISMVARRLTVPGVAAVYNEGGEPLAADDPRINTPAPRAETAGRTGPIVRL